MQEEWNQLVLVLGVTDMVKRVTMEDDYKINRLSQSTKCFFSNMR